VRIVKAESCRVSCPSDLQPRIQRWHSLQCWMGPYEAGSLSLERILLNHSWGFNLVISNVRCLEQVWNVFTKLALPTPDWIRWVGDRYSWINVRLHDNPLVPPEQSEELRWHNSREERPFAPKFTEWHWDNPWQTESTDPNTNLQKLFGLLKLLWSSSKAKQLP
jgi:hypothetical protein